MGMKDVIKLDRVEQYNDLFGLETLHPLVSVVDLSQATCRPDHFVLNYGVCPFPETDAVRRHPLWQTDL